MKLSHVFRVLVSVSALAVGTVATVPAAACGPMPERSASQDVRSTIDAHFSALNAHNARSLLQHWAPTARVVSVNPWSPQAMSVLPVQVAAQRWVKEKQPTTFAIERIDVSGNKAFVAMRVLFGGVSHQDQVFLEQQSGVWKIVAKSSRPLSTRSPTQAKLAQSAPY